MKNTEVILTENRPNGAEWRGVVKPFMLKSIEGNQYSGGFKRYDIDIYDEVEREPSKKEIKEANEFFDKVGGRYAKGSTIKNKYEHNDFPIMFVEIPFGYGKKQGMLVTKLYNLLKKHNIEIDNSKEWHTKGFGEEYENDENHNIVKFNVKDAPNPKKLTEILWNLPNGEYYVSATKDYKYANGSTVDSNIDADKLRKGSIVRMFYSTRKSEYKPEWKIIKEYDLDGIPFIDYEADCVVKRVTPKFFSVIIPHLNAESVNYSKRAFTDTKYSYGNYGSRKPTIVKYANGGGVDNDRLWTYDIKEDRILIYPTIEFIGDEHNDIEDIKRQLRAEGYKQPFIVENSNYWTYDIKGDHILIYPTTEDDEDAVGYDVGSVMKQLRAEGYRQALVVSEKKYANGGGVGEADMETFIVDVHSELGEDSYTIEATDGVQAFQEARYLFKKENPEYKGQIDLSMRDKYANGGGVGAYDYKTVDLRTEKGIKEAERLKEQGWKIVQMGFETMQFERPKANSFRSVGRSMYADGGNTSSGYSYSIGGL